MRNRRVGNLTAVAVLSVLAQRPMYPYEMVATLRHWGKDRDMPVKWGSLYTVVRNLAKHALIEPIESTREGARPQRTVYRITDDGRAELLDWARELVAVPATEQPRFRAGLSVLAVIPPDEVGELLRRRIDALEDRAAAERADLDRHRGTIPRLFLIESEYDLAVQDAEIEWTRQLLRELETGSFEGLDDWRNFHATGVMPVLSDEGGTER